MYMVKKSYTMAIHDIERRMPGLRDPALEDDGFPYHVTFTPPAMGKLSVENVLDEFRAIASLTEPFELAVKGKANFGTEANPMWVTEYSKNQNAARLHKQLVKALYMLDHTLDLTWTDLGSMGWTPHSTDMQTWPEQTTPILLKDITLIQRNEDDLVIVDRLPFAD